MFQVKCVVETYLAYWIIKVCQANLTGKRMSVS